MYITINVVDKFIDGKVETINRKGGTGPPSVVEIRNTALLALEGRSRRTACYVKVVRVMSPKESINSLHTSWRCSILTV